MALEFNVGELATRLRSALGVRGRMPLALDEYCIPTVKAGDVSVPPYRRSPVRFSVSLYHEVGAGLRAGLNIGAGPGYAGQLFVIDRIRLTPRDYLTATGGVTGFGECYLFVRPGFGPTGGAAVTMQATTLERYPQPTGGVPANTLGVPLWIDGVATNVIAPSAEPNRIMQEISHQAQRSGEWTPTELPLLANTVLTVWSASTTAGGGTSAVQVDVQGLMYEARGL